MTTATPSRILLADGNRALSERTAEALRGRPGAPELVGVEDGGRFLMHFSRLARAGQTPKLCVLETQLAQVSGGAAALMMRAVERGLSLAPVPLLFYTLDPVDDALKRLIGRLGRAVHLQKAPGLSTDEHSGRLVQALERLMAQLGGT